MPCVRRSTASGRILYVLQLVIIAFSHRKPLFNLVEKGLSKLTAEPAKRFCSYDSEATLVNVSSVTSNKSPAP